MTKKIGIIFISIILLVSACDMVTYEGPYNQDGYFNGTKSAYFHIKEERDTLQSFSFALRPQSEVEHTFRIPVRILGTPSSHTTKVGITVVPEKTNAKEGIHYKSIPSFLEIPADSINGYAEVTMLRDALPKNDIEKTIITIALTSTPDYQVVGGERNEVTLSVDDFFDDASLSEYWNLYFSGILGVYDRTVYLKFLESYDWDQDLLMSEFFQTTRFWTNWALTVQYFEQRPELGIAIVLPDWMKGYLPYQD